MTQKKTDSQKKHLSQNIPNIWVDNIELHLREDDICFLRMSTELPEGHFEQAHFFMSRKLLEKFLTGIANSIDFYPEPQEKGKKVPKNKKKGESE